MHLIWLVLLSGGSAWATHSYLSDKAAREGNSGAPGPTLMGFDASKLMAGVGIGALILGSPVIAAIGVGAAIGSFITKGTMQLAAEAYQAGAQPQLPGPRPVTMPSPAPARRPGGFLSALYQPGRFFQQQPRA